MQNFRRCLLASPLGSLPYSPSPHRCTRIQILYLILSFDFYPSYGTNSINLYFKDFTLFSFIAWCILCFVFPTKEKILLILSLINSLGHFSLPRSSHGHGKRLQEEVVEIFYILATRVNRGFPIICTCKTIQCKNYSFQTNIPCQKNFLENNIS